ncbi:putative HAT transposon superfamily protein [Melia azedarach]|uniref:HAT transposon superfamily protein n=1 Tax=Melia azedarach TaxID=155640 RepID=A0ACC1XZV9_MELAZ|nr:putative HAT transposon superfamily protein [Melia azedarach]
MATNNISINVHDHGMALDDKRKKVQCNYCSKVVSGFYRLKCHLGAIRGDVLPCVLVPSNIKEYFNTKLNEVKRKNLIKEVDNLQYPDLPLMRRSTKLLQDIDPVNTEVSKSTSRKRLKETSTSGDGSRRRQYVLPDRRLQPYFKELLKSKTAEILHPQLELPKESQQCIGRFFYETGIDLSAVNTTTFNQMINANQKQGEARYKPPTSTELKWTMLREEVRSMKEYVKKVQECLLRTGCSILVDEWVNVEGRYLVNFLVDCPEGTIYIQSFDLSAYVGDIVALQTILNEVIEEVGAKNIVQIITSSTKSQMWHPTRKVVELHKNMFRTSSASYYIGIILEHMGKVKPYNETVTKAKTFTRFIHGHSTVLKLFRCYSHGNDLVKPHKHRPVLPYLTLENIVSQKQYLKELFTSSEWTNSSWASSTEGKWAANLLNDFSFWKDANILLKATTPFIRILHQSNGAENGLQVGYIYESFRQAKEEIKDKIYNYMAFWNVIDEVWDIYLHPLHSAGYYLNPRLFFNKNFYSDSEVECGLKNCIENMVEDCNLRALIYQQLEEYEKGEGAFKAGSSIEAVKNISPGD